MPRNEAGASRAEDDTKNRRNTPETGTRYGGCGAPSGIRTHDLFFTREMLYP